MLGSMMKININWTQMLTGLQLPVFESKQEIVHIPNNWFLQLRKFLSDIDGKIIIQKCWVPQIKRQNDCIIMEQLQHINITNVNKQSRLNGRHSYS
jgi:hypothetical protein